MFKNKKTKLLLLLMFLIMSSMIGITLAKYMTKIDTLPKLTLDIKGFDYLRVSDTGKATQLLSGFTSGSTSITITEDDTYNVTFSGISTSGLYEKANIPIYFSKTGLYQLEFTVVCNQPILYEENNQVYGCTVSDSINLGTTQNTRITTDGISTSGFFWKSIKSQTAETVCISFLVTDVTKPMYWIWDFSGINDANDWMKIRIFDVQLVDSGAVVATTDLLEDEVILEERDEEDSETINTILNEVELNEQMELNQIESNELGGNEFIQEDEVIESNTELNSNTELEQDIDTTNIVDIQESTSEEKLEEGANMLLDDS